MSIQKIDKSQIWGDKLTPTERILLLMEQNNINAATLTREISLTNGVISQWKRGKQKPSTDAIIKIANYFHVTTDYILLGVEGIDSSLDSTTSASDQEWLDLIHQLPEDVQREYKAEIKGYVKALNKESGEMPGKSLA